MKVGRGNPKVLLASKASKARSSSNRDLWVMTMPYKGLSEAKTLDDLLKAVKEDKPVKRGMLW